MSYRVYIDESGDHTYNRLDDPSRRYLGLTGVIFHKVEYDPAIPQAMEALKRQHTVYDIDHPPILTRRKMVDRKGQFWVLRDNTAQDSWEKDLLAFLSMCPMQVFTVVFDKQAHIENYGAQSWNPYAYSLRVLLGRIHNWLIRRQHGRADIMPESRGKAEDDGLAEAYATLRNQGMDFLTADQLKSTYPEDTLLFRRKDQNVAGLQIADMLAPEQKLLAIQESRGAAHRGIGPFGQRVNEAIAGKVNDYGRILV